MGNGLDRSCPISDPRIARTGGWHGGGYRSFRDKRVDGEVAPTTVIVGWRAVDRSEPERKSYVLLSTQLTWPVTLRANVDAPRPEYC